MNVGAVFGPKHWERLPSPVLCLNKPLPLIYIYLWSMLLPRLLSSAGEEKKEKKKSSLCCDVNRNYIIYGH